MGESGELRLITSATNPLVKRIRALRDRQHRAREGAFVVEGILPVWQAVEAGAAIDTLVIAPDLLRGSPAEAMVAGQEAAGVRVARLSAELFGRISDRDGPSGLAAIVASRLLSVDDLDVGPDAVVVVLVDVANPGNLGTVLRTADAAGVSAMVLAGHTADPFAPAAVKASMGALFAVPIARVSTVDDVLMWARTSRLTVVAASGSAPLAHWDTTYRRPVALLLGSEREGLPDDVVARADVAVRIPMTGTTESLNLGVATGILLYELIRPAGQH